MDEERLFLAILPRSHFHESHLLGSMAEISGEPSSLWRCSAQLGALAAYRQTGTA
jgi:hypothetical protein